MKIYKKREIGKMIFCGIEIFLGYVRNRRRRYKTSEILRLSRSSIVNNCRGLEGVFTGNIAKVNPEREGVEEKKVSIRQVVVKGRVVPYDKFCKYKKREEGVVELIIGWRR